MFPILSITGLFKTLLIIIGAFVLLRFLGRLATAKRNLDLERQMNEQKKAYESEKRNQQRKVGKTEIIGKKPVNNSVQDVDFEEVE